MKTSRVVSLVLAALLAATTMLPAQETRPVETEPEPLSPLEAKFQGTWKPNYTIIIEGRDFCADTQPGEWYEGYIVIRPDEEPAQIDFVIEEDASGPNGQTSKGIFYFDGETIVVLAPPPGKARPQDFEKSDDPRVLMRLKPGGKSQHPATHCLGETP